MPKLDLENYRGGVLPPLDDPTEYQFGALSGIVHESRNTLKDWRLFEPTPEAQKYSRFDTYGCASFSGHNSLEIQFNLLIKSNLIRQEDLNWLKEKGYFDESGKINFDDRWIVLLSGTKPGVGNYLATIWDTIRKVGLVPQGSVPFNENWTEYQYYDKSDFPKEAYGLGLEFLKRFYIQYERVATDDNTLKKALEHAPLHIGTPICPGWNDGGIVKYCNEPARHATVLTFVGAIKGDFDSYEPYHKELARTYKIDFAYKGVISPVVSVDGKKKLKNFCFEKNMKQGDYNNDIVELAKRLIEENYWVDDEYNPPGPLYGQEVARAVRNYQRQNGITNWWQDIMWRGKFCGPETRLLLNSKPLKY